MVAQRLRTQRLTSAPMPEPADVVRLLTCVQAQDAPLARYSVGMRTVDCTDETVRRAVDEGRLLRTHILRPTWHYVAPEDLRWILALTSSKVESSLAARHRQLGLDAGVLDAAMSVLQDALRGRRHLTRRSLGAELAEAGSPWTGEQLGHLLLVAELRGMVCSGPLNGDLHTYGLVDELVPPAPALDRPDAVRRLVARFFAGHGPATVADLVRWTRVTRTEVRAALRDLDGHLEHVTVGGEQLWFDPSTDRPESTSRRAFLLPVFDEAYLSYPRVNLPRAADHPGGSAAHSFAEAGGGVVVLDRRDVGWWKRTNKGRRVEVRLVLAPSVDLSGRDVVGAEASRLAEFTGRTADLIIRTG